MDPIDSNADATDTLWRVALDYHDRTKHHFRAYARSLGYMDWATQPHPFRRFEGAPLHSLPLPAEDDTPDYDALFADTAEAQPVTVDTISRLFFYSLALSAWKRAGPSRWALRVNPSSGNLHPTEAYLVAGPIEGLHDAPAVYHYASDQHTLERLADLPPDALEPGQIAVVLTSIPWREAWKYGERAFRYCQHDVGHAIAALRLSTAMLGWRMRFDPAVGDPTIRAQVGLDRPDASHEGEPEVADAWLEINGSIAPAEPIRWYGQANRLSHDHHPWEVIDEVERAAHRQDGWTAPPAFTGQAPPPRPGRNLAAGPLVRRRRSAVAMDGTTSLSREAFYRLLERLMPGQVPFDTLPWSPQVHLGLFVHRVDGLAPGAYALVRDPGQVSAVRDAMNDAFEWVVAEGAPDHLPLYRLVAGDAQGAAMNLSCGQEIARDSVFSVGMLAWFEGPLRSYGASMYRHLFWETGLVGQMLYLEAEAAGVRGTGIGCFFDDPVHELFGLSGHRMQSLYHFTVGGAVDDARLTTEEPYAALRAR